MKRLFASLVLMSLVGCVHTDSVSANLEGQAPYGIVTMGPYISYVIDARTETCLLVYGTASAVTVSCAMLKKNVPEAVRYITWDVGTESAPVPAPREASPQPSASSN